MAAALQPHVLRTILYVNDMIMTGTMTPSSWAVYMLCTSLACLCRLIAFHDVPNMCGTSRSLCRWVGLPRRVPTACPPAPAPLHGQGTTSPSDVLKMCRPLPPPPPAPPPSPLPFPYFRHSPQFPPPLPPPSLGSLAGGCGPPSALLASPLTPNPYSVSQPARLFGCLELGKFVGGFVCANVLVVLGDARPLALNPVPCLSPLSPCSTWSSGRRTR